MMTARTINAMVRDGEACGRYVYAKTPESIITGAWQRVIKARARCGVLRVKVLGSGQWRELLDNGVTLQ